MPWKQAADKKWWAMTALQFGATFFDLASTDYALHRLNGREANPILGQSAPRRYAISLGLAGASSFLTLWRKKNQMENRLNFGGKGGNWWAWSLAPPAAHFAAGIHNFAIAAGHPVCPSGTSCNFTATSPAGKAGP